MNQVELQNALSDLPLGDLRYFSSIGSTNDEALVWAAQGAPDLSLVVADEQTAGRGRAGRKWYTPPGAALAFSVILRPSAADTPLHTRTVGLAALAVAESLRTRSLASQIKWPNDILVDGRKVAGILLESVWVGALVDFAIVGIGVNVSGSAVPLDRALNFPATSLEAALGRSPDRAGLLHDILAALLAWRAQIGTDGFMQAWERLLAFRGQRVQIHEGGQPALTGLLAGLEPDGSLRLEDPDGRPLIVYFGDVRLRPAL